MTWLRWWAGTTTWLWCLYAHGRHHIVWSLSHGNQRLFCKKCGRSL